MRARSCALIRIWNARAPDRYWGLVLLRPNLLDWKLHAAGGTRFGACNPLLCYGVIDADLRGCRTVCRNGYKKGVDRWHEQAGFCAGAGLD
jgi:hypothetical protein